MTGRPELAAVGGKPDAQQRRWLFEKAYPAVVIVPPGGLNDPWRAVLQPGTIPADPTATTLSSWQLAGLMDQLEELLPPGAQDAESAGDGR